MPANPPPNSVQRRRTADRVARRAVQIGFLLLFLYPLFLVIYQRVTFRAAPNLASWLLPWDPLLLTGHLARREWAEAGDRCAAIVDRADADPRAVLLRLGLPHRHGARSGAAVGVLAETAQAVARDAALPGQCQQPSALLSVDRGGARRPFLAASARPARPAGDLPARDDGARQQYLHVAAASAARLSSRLSRCCSWRLWRWSSGSHASGAATCARWAR